MKIIINNNSYDYMDDEFIKEIFKNYINDDVINLDRVSSEDKYYCTEKLFNYICHMVTSLSGDPFPTKELKEENEKIRENMNKVDTLQKYLKDHGKEKESINNMEKFLSIMLEHNNKYMEYGDEFVEEDEYGII